MSKLLSALLTGIGALLGVALFVANSAGLAIAAVAAMCVLLVGLALSRSRFSSNPVRWSCVLEIWILSLPLASALGVALLLFATYRQGLGTTVLPLPGLEPTVRSDVVKFVSGVLTGIAAAAASLDPETNWFWPVHHFKCAAKAMIGNMSEADDPFRFYAVQMERTRCGEVEGWGFKARRVRARHLASPPAIEGDDPCAYLKPPAAPPPDAGKAVPPTQVPGQAGA
jgi:hypothetical protein